MSVALETERVTLEEFDQYADDYELVEGALEERPTMGLAGARAKLRVASRMFAHCEANDLGETMVEEDVVMEAGPPATVRRPDVVFWGSAKARAFVDPRGRMKTVPDQVVEIVSEHDEAEKVAAKLGEYLAKGVRRVWLVYPLCRQVHVFREDGTAQFLREGAVLDGEDVFPGFRLPLAELFGPIIAGPGTTGGGP